VKIGLQIPQFKPSTPETMRSWLKDTVQTVDQGGFDSLWVMDHFFQLGRWMGEPETEMIEGYTTLGFFAGLTEKVKIGLMVGGVIYRHPAVVIKIVSTLDVLSGGRAYFGIGAAWYEHETKSLGMRFPPMKERFEQLEEILQIAHHMWEGVDPDIHRHIEEEVPEYKCQVAFMGTNKAGRERLLREVMKAGFDLKIWGTRWPGDMPVVAEFIGEDDFARACFNADIVLGLNDNNKIRDYFSLRTALTLASRGFHVTSYVPGIENWFVNGTHVAWFRVRRKKFPPWHTDFSDCTKVIAHYLDKPDERRRIALEGQKHVYAFFTWEYQLGKVAEKLKEILAGEKS